MKDSYRQVLNFICPNVRRGLMEIPEDRLHKIEEIRMRSGRPLMLCGAQGEWFVGADHNATDGHDGIITITSNDIANTLELMSEKSIYAFQDEIKNGFITLKEGHRVGICGRAVLENNKVKTLRDISGLNIRISREIVGCSESVAKYVIKNQKDVYNTLIISPPSCGKTTIIRDLARLIGSGNNKLNFMGIRVGIVDERCEIASCYKGTPQKNIGTRTDVIDGCSKSEGILMLLRSMSPQVIITDEIGDEGDADSVRKLINAGVRIIATVHGYNLSELKVRKEVLKMLDEKVFERFVVLGNKKGPGTLEEVIDCNSKQIL